MIKAGIGQDAIMSEALQGGTGTAKPASKSPKN